MKQRRGWRTRDLGWANLILGGQGRPLGGGDIVDWDLNDKKELAMWSSQKAVPVMWKDPGLGGRCCYLVHFTWGNWRTGDTKKLVQSPSGEAGIRIGITPEFQPLIISWNPFSRGIFPKMCSAEQPFCGMLMMCCEKKRAAGPNGLGKVLDSIEFTEGLLRLPNMQVCISHSQEGEGSQVYLTCFCLAALVFFIKHFGKKLS